MLQYPRSIRANFCNHPWKVYVDFLHLASFISCPPIFIICAINRAHRSYPERLGSLLNWCYMLPASFWNSVRFPVLDTKARTSIFSGFERYWSGPLRLCELHHDYFEDLCNIFCLPFGLIRSSVKCIWLYQKFSLLERRKSVLYCVGAF